MQDKAAALPPEPTVEEGATTACLIRLPDGTRLSRRFHASDPLRLLFDFVDAKAGFYMAHKSHLQPIRCFMRFSFLLLVHFTTIADPAQRFCTHKTRWCLHAWSQQGLQIEGGCEPANTACTKAD